MKRWKYARVEERRMAIRSELKSYDGDASLALDFLQTKIRSLSNSIDTEALLDCFLYILFALSTSARHRLLSIKEVQDLERQARDILRIQKIDVESRGLGSLARDLCALLSQDARSRGDHVRSLWELAIGSRFVDRNTSYRHSTKALALAIRQQRLGHIPASLASLQLVLDAPESEINTRMALCQRLKGLRLTKEWAEHAKEVDSLLTRVVDERSLQEIQWERICADASVSQNFYPMFNAANNPSGSHHSECYILEAMLWSFASPVKEHGRFFAQIESISRRRDMSFRKREPLYQYCRDFQGLIEASIPLERRLRQAYQLFELAKQLPGIDHELMALLGIARFLLRSSQLELGNIVMAEYRGLSLKCTAGASDDALNIALDCQTSVVTDAREAG